jgi:hypothetical protein
MTRWLLPFMLVPFFGMTQIPILDNTHRLFVEYQNIENDTIDHKPFLGFVLPDKTEKLGGEVFNKRKNEGVNNIEVQLLLNTALGLNSSNAAAGLALSGQFKKWSFYIAPSVGLYQNNQWVRRQTEFNYIQNNQTILSKNKSGMIGFSSPFAVQYKPSKYFTFSGGVGKQFIGEGQRSILLTDFSKNHPYLSVVTEVWKLKYINLISGYYYDQNSELTFYLPNKFSTTHYLSWDVFKWLNIGAFETVMWKSQDTLLNRGIDVNYLNPVIFYRPVEYSTGSSDNVLMGIAGTIKIRKKLKIYGQLLIDEFLLKYISADIKHAINPNAVTAEPTGWWGNKHSGQAGLKWFDAFNLDGLIVRGEVNYSRPYTYSHLNPSESYSHFNSPLAHPLGANFKEWMVNLHYIQKNWAFEGYFNYLKKGFDFPTNYSQNQLNGPIVSGNYGGNVINSYNTRVNEFGTFTGQGNTYSYSTIGIKAGYFLNPEINLKAFVHVAASFTTAGKVQEVIRIGVSTNLSNSYFDL